MMVGEHVKEHSGDITGLMVSIKSYEDNIAIWHKTALEKEIRMEIFEGMRRSLKLDANTVLEQREHPSTDKERNKTLVLHFDGLGQPIQPEKTSEILKKQGLIKEKEQSKPQGKSDYNNYSRGGESGQGDG